MPCCSPASCGSFTPFFTVLAHQRWQSNCFTCHYQKSAICNTVKSAKSSANLQLWIFIATKFAKDKAATICNLTWCAGEQKRIVCELLCWDAMESQWTEQTLGGLLFWSTWSWHKVHKHSTISFYFTLHFYIFFYISVVEKVSSTFCTFLVVGFLSETWKFIQKLYLLLWKMKI